LVRLIEVVWINTYSSDLAILPVRYAGYHLARPQSMIAATFGFGPDDRIMFGGTRSLWVNMIERSDIYFKSTGVLKLLDSVGTLKWPSEM
jgi:hypothetical protein